MSCTLVQVYKRFIWNICFRHQGIKLITWNYFHEGSHFMVTFGRTSDFTLFVQFQSYKIHLTKTKSLAVPLHLHVKLQTVPFFSSPLKHFSEFTIAHSACYEAHLLYPTWFGYANKTNNRLQMYNFTIHTALWYSFSSLSWHRQHNGRCVWEACCCLTELAVSGQSDPAYSILHVCYQSRLSIDTPIELD
jgi:hypothetical protein